MGVCGKGEKVFPPSQVVCAIIDQTVQDCNRPDSRSPSAEQFIHSCTLSPFCFTFLSQVPDLASTKAEQHPLCCIEATGVHPTIRIAAACSAGSAGGISRLLLWRLLSLDTLNEYLQRDPAPSELTYRVPTRHR